MSVYLCKCGERFHCNVHDEPQEGAPLAQATPVDVPVHGTGGGVPSCDSELAALRRQVKGLRDCDPPMAEMGVALLRMVDELTEKLEESRRNEHDMIQRMAEAEVAHKALVKEHAFDQALLNSYASTIGELRKTNGQ